MPDEVVTISDADLGIVRDARGRLMPGSKLVSPGRPRTPPDAPKRLKRAMLLELTDDKLRALIATHIERGIAGSVASARLILEYAVGKPREQLPVGDVARVSLWAFIQEVRSAADEPQPHVIEGAASRSSADEPEAPGISA